jgi:hypothetical protein
MALSKYLILLLLVSCATTPKCNNLIYITAIECPKDAKEDTMCKILFSDNSDFYVPKSLTQYVAVNQTICMDKK